MRDEHQLGPHCSYWQVRAILFLLGSCIDNRSPLSKGVIIQVLDFSASTPSAKAVKASGYGGAVRYISPARQSWMQAKPATKAQTDQYRAESLSQAFVWQYGGSESPDTLRGFKGGVEDAKAANDNLIKAGCAGYPVFFAVDFNATLAQWNSTIVEYFKGAASVLGVSRVGIYGHSRIIAWAVEDGAIGRAGSKYLAWQTKAWSNGERAPEAVLYQGTVNVTGPEGIQVDVNDVLNDYWGQGPVSSTPTPKKEVSSKMAITPKPEWRGDPTFLPDVLKAFGCSVDILDGAFDRGHGDFGAIKGIIVHHIGSNKYAPYNIAHHPELGLCAQLHLSREGKYTLCGVGVAYHAGRGSYPGWQTNNANWEAIGIEAESNGTDPWPAAEMDAYYRGCAAILWFLGKRATTQTLLSHWEYSRAAQGKWDPGAGNGVSGAVMEMNSFRDRVNHYIDNPPFLTNSEEDDDVAFDEITRKYKSRVDGSTVTMRPIDALLNVDAHSFVSRANSEKIMAEQKRQAELLAKIAEKVGV